MKVLDIELVGRGIPAIDRYDESGEAIVWGGRYVLHFTAAEWSSELGEELQRRHGINFCTNQEPEYFDFYPVPALFIFATGGGGCCYAARDYCGGEVLRVYPNGHWEKLEEDFAAFLSLEPVSKKADPPSELQPLEIFKNKKMAEEVYFFFSD